VECEAYSSEVRLKLLLMNAYQKPGLYVHIPFCRTKCPYCGFFSIASTCLISRWLDAFRKEIGYHKHHFKCFDSLYIGGGTPTVLCTKDLEKIIQCLFRDFEFGPETEITIEANPGDLNRKKVDGLKALGFNRINLGVQSFNDQELHFLGRRHTSKEAGSALKRLRSSGFNNLGIDLIYGLEGQRLKGWIETLKQALAFWPEHISCYQLTFERKTPFWNMKAKGVIRPIDEEKGRSFFLATSGFLEEKGYIHYEVSNFARKRAYYSRHNYKYWHHVPYLGLGPSAHSFQNKNRWWNFRSIRRYCEALESHRAPIEEYENLTAEQMRIESIALGLRTREGFHIKETDDNSQSRDMLSRLQRSGFLEIKNDRIMPTQKGFLVADRLPLCFIG
jgi:oxygen-independent coproporphyrinogen-3 oxidase